MEALIATRRREPKDDFLSRLIEATDGEEGALDDSELRALATQLIVAGNETTRFSSAPWRCDSLRSPDWRSACETTLIRG
jgi:cytochrome P450